MYRVDVMVNGTFKNKALLRWRHSQHRQPPSQGIMGYFTLTLRQKPFCMIYSLFLFLSLSFFLSLSLSFSLSLSLSHTHTHTQYISWFILSLLILKSPSFLFFSFLFCFLFSFRVLPFVSTAHEPFFGGEGEK